MCARDVLTRSGAAVTYQRATTATTCHIEAGSGRVGGDVQIAAQQVTVSAERDPRQHSPGYNLGQTCASLASAHGVGKPELLWHRHMQKQLKPSCTVMATHCTLRSLSSQPGTVLPAIPTLDIPSHDVCAYAWLHSHTMRHNPNTSLQCLTIRPYPVPHAHSHRGITQMCPCRWGSAPVATPRPR